MATRSAIKFKIIDTLSLRLSTRIAIFMIAKGYWSESKGRGFIKKSIKLERIK